MDYLVVQVIKLLLALESIYRMRVNNSAYLVVVR